MYKLYSEREQTKNKNSQQDIYEYEKFPSAFRNQFFHAVSNVFDSGYGHNFWERCCKTYANEKGLKYLDNPSSIYVNTKNSYEYYVDSSSDYDFRDLLDFTLVYIDEKVRKVLGEDIANDAINEINDRLSQHNLGYEYKNTELIPKTNKIVHSKIIKPILYLLHCEEFAGAEEEFFNSLNSYAHKQNKDAISYASKAFESTLKTICVGMKYSMSEKTDKAKELLHHLKQNGFYPSYLQNYYDNLGQLMEKGAPCIRNNEPGIDHGQGKDVQVVDDLYAEYMINMVAINMLFLVKLYNTSKNE